MQYEETKTLGRFLVRSNRRLRWVRRASALKEAGRGRLRRLFKRMGWRQRVLQNGDSQSAKAAHLQRMQQANRSRREVRARRREKRWGFVVIRHLRCVRGDCRDVLLRGPFIWRDALGADE